MNLRVVGMADCAVTADRTHVLITYALGSCIAVAVHDPVAGVAGMLHYMLPESSIDPQKAVQNRFMFADTGIPLLFQQVCQLGAQKNRMTVHVAGGAKVMDDNGVFNIGRRNYLALRKILWKAGVLIHSEDVGGTASRTIRLEVETGRFWLRSGGEPERELTAKRAAEGVAGWQSQY